MIARFVLTEYVQQALALAEYDKLEDGTFAGRIPGFAGVLAFAPTLAECESQLQSVLEDWIWLGLKLKHPLPVLADLDLNCEPVHEPLGAD